MGRGSVGTARLALVSDRDGAPGGAERGARGDGAELRVRIVDGALASIARQGVAKTTLDDVARQARCARATIYRAFPGGKEGLLHAVADTELSRFFSALAVRMGEGADIEDVLVRGITEAVERIESHGALRYLLEHEAEVALPHLAFSHMDHVLEVASGFLAPFLGRWLPWDESVRVIQQTTRIVTSYLLSPAPGIDLATERDARHFVVAFILPGIDLPGSEIPSFPVITTSARAEREDSND